MACLQFMGGRRKRWGPRRERVPEGNRCLRGTNPGHKPSNSNARIRPNPPNLPFSAPLDQSPKNPLPGAYLDIEFHDLHEKFMYPKAMALGDQRILKILKIGYTLSPQKS